MLKYAQFSFSGDPEVAEVLAESFASLPEDDTEPSVPITWGAPRRSLGISGTAIELHGAFGIISIPVSIVAGVIANMLTRRLKAAKAKLDGADPEAATRASQLSISVTFVGSGDESSRVEIKLSQGPSAIQVDLERTAAKQMRHAEDTDDSRAD